MATKFYIKDLEVKIAKRESKITEAENSVNKQIVGEGVFIVVAIFLK